MADRNMRGLRGRDGQWYFGVTQGRGLRNTFVGGLITSPTGLNPLRAAFRGAQIDVLLNEKQDHGLWLSEVNDLTGLALRPDRAAALGARYTLQKSLINGIPTPETPASPWQVTQIWRAAGEGIIGMIALEATADTPAQAVVGRLALGPGPIEREADGSWSCGPLRVKLLQSFGKISVVNVPGYAQPKDRAWPGLEMRIGLDGTKKGMRFVYAAWIGPREATPPTSLTPLNHLRSDVGWTVTWPDGQRKAVLFNPTKSTLAMNVRWDSAPLLWRGESGKATRVQVQDGTVALSLEAGAVALLETAD
jgi:hypothetical protein